MNKINGVENVFNLNISNKVKKKQILMLTIYLIRLILARMIFKVTHYST